MPYPSKVDCQILIAGAGFAGSLTALALHQCGFEVCLVERDRHPRFAIGESSTPIADMILRDLSSRYDLPWLDAFSRYGSWQQAYPEITCGLKRGFSYYKHQPAAAFSTSPSHNRELLVAASSSDANSDTNWLRSDFDAFLVKKVQEYGIPYFDRTDITGCTGSPGRKYHADHPEGRITFTPGFFIDATGSPALLQKLLAVKQTTRALRTNSRALYAHFEEVPRWTGFLNSAGISTSDYPYDPDHSALHHLLDKGWLWMLRFNDGRTSIGIMLNRNRLPARPAAPPEQEWKTVVSSYPTLRQLLGDIRLATNPGKIISTGRVQRRLSQAHGEQWAALPHTVGFIDPLHSSGIAHTLSGVEKMVRILDSSWNERDRLAQKLASYEESLFGELELVDRLVSGCYEVMDRFELFNIWSMLYFTAAITYEQQRLNGKAPSHFLCAGNPEITDLINRTFDELQKMAASGAGTVKESDIRQFRENVRSRIDPYNIAGLLNPDIPNMYRHTAVEL